MIRYFDPEVKYRSRISTIIVLSVSIFAATINRTDVLLAAALLNVYLPFIIIRPFYLTVRNKYILSLISSILWGFFSYSIAKTWISELAIVTNSVISYLTIFGIAVIPGFMNAFMVSSLLIDLRPRRKNDKIIDYSPITILIAAYNEGSNILSTLESLERQHYPGKLTVIVINDGSTDNTATVVKSVLPQYPWLKLLDLENNGGKSSALNHGLKLVETDLTITVDGDSYLFKNALKHLVERYLSDPDNTVAVAGAVLVRNSRKNIVTKIQEWDYFHGIAAIKRIQSLYHGTLVAQGAFSLYKTTVLREIGGWPHCVGEDIVLTWSILKRNYRVGFAEDACLFTNAPDTWVQFIRQRQRWSRGLVEAFKLNWKLLFKPRMTTLFIWWNLLFFYLDIVYTFAFIPGLVLAAFGIYWIAGPMTLIVLPLALLVNWIMYNVQVEMFVSQGLKVRRNIIGFVGYMLFYGMILQPACVLGYIKEIIMGKYKTWGTK